MKILGANEFNGQKSILHLKDSLKIREWP